jgi:hypothetical protein
MSVGRSIEDNGTKTLAQLYAMLGMGDTAILKGQKFKLDTDHQIVDGGGISVDRQTVFLDEELYRRIMAGEITVESMTAIQIINCLCDHEHTEKCVADGDNPVDNYPPAHVFGNTDENRGVEATGAKPAGYNAALAPDLKRCELQTPRKVPLTLWCAPYLDDPDANDERVLEIFRALGVVDAFKASKKTVHYGIGENECRGCRYFHLSPEPEQLGVLGLCDKVCGLVRVDRQCDWWEATPAEGERVWSLTDQG